MPVVLKCKLCESEHRRYRVLKSNVTAQLVHVRVWHCAMLRLGGKLYGVVDLAEYQQEVYGAAR